MRRGLLVLVTLLVLGVFVPSVFAQEEARTPSITADIAQSTSTPANRIDPVVEQALNEAVPDLLRSKVLIWTISCSLFASLCGFLAKRFDWQRVAAKHTCTHCIRIHSIGGMIALLCDTSSTAGLFYIASLPYVSAIKAHSDKVQAVGIGVLLLMAFCLLLIVVGAFVRLFTPRSKLFAKRRFDAFNSFLAGQRIIGFVLTLLVLDSGFTSEAVADNFTSLFGLHLAERLLTAIGVVPIRDTAVVLILSVCASFFFRWIFPSLCQSRPLALSRSEGPMHRSSELAKS